MSLIQAPVFYGHAFAVFANLPGQWTLVALAIAWRRGISSRTAAPVPGVERERGRRAEGHVEPAAPDVAVPHGYVLGGGG